MQHDRAVVFEQAVIVTAARFVKKIPQSCLPLCSTSAGKQWERGQTGRDHLRRQNGTGVIKRGWPLPGCLNSPHFSADGGGAEKANAAKYRSFGCIDRAESGVSQEADFLISSALR